MMDDIENYDNISIAGIQKSLDSVFGAIDFNKYSQYVKLRVNDFCAQNGYIMDQAFDGSHEQKLVVSGDIIGQISLSDPDRDSKIQAISDNINSIYDGVNKKIKVDFDNEKRRSIESMIGAANYKIKEFEEKKQERQDEINLIELEKSTLEAEIDDIKALHGGNIPSVQDEDFAKYDEVSKSYAECEKRINKLSAEFSNQENAILLYKKTVENIKNKLKEHNIDIDITKTLAPKEKEKNVEKNKEAKSVKNSEFEQIDNNQMQQMQPIQVQLPQQNQAYQQPNMPINQIQNQDQAENSEKVKNQVISNFREKIPELSDEEKKKRVMAIIEKSNGKSYTLNDDNEISIIASILEDNEFAKKLGKDRNTLENILKSSIEKNENEISSLGKDNIKKCIKEFLPDLDGVKIDELLKEVYGNDPSKTKFLENKLSSDSKKILMDIIENVNRKQNELFSYIQNEDKASKLNESGNKDKFLNDKNNIENITKALITPINLKESLQKIESTKGIFKKGKLDSGVSELSKYSRVGLTSFEKTATNKFKKGLEEDVYSAEEAAKIAYESANEERGKERAKGSEERQI